MKLGEWRTGRKRLRSREMVTGPEEPRDSFDPRLDLPPGEWERLRGMIRRKSNILGPGKITTYPELGWLAMVDETARDDLRGIPGYKDFLVEEVAQKAKFINPSSESADWERLFIFIAKVLQEFPETRGPLKDLMHANNLDFLLRLPVFRLASQVKKMSIELIQIWPKEQKRIGERFFPDGFNLEKFEHEITRTSPDMEAVHLAAQVVLLFPEHKEQIISAARPFMMRLKSNLHHFQGSTASEFSNYQRAIRDLTILSANRAWIADDGTLQVDFPKPTLHPVPPMPERSLD